MNSADQSADGLPWLNLGLDAWLFGLEASQIGLRTICAVSDLSLRMLSDLPDATDVAASVESQQRDHELLTAMLPRDEIRDAPLRMYPGSRDVVPWRYDEK